MRLIKLFLFLGLLFPLFGSEEEGEYYLVNFPKVPMSELIRFVSKICEVNFTAENDLLDFEVSFISGKKSSPEEILEIVLDLLKNYHLEVVHKNHCYLIRKMEETPPTQLTPSLLPKLKNPEKFHIHKLQYHQGSEIMEAIKKISSDLKDVGSEEGALMGAIHSLQWIPSTNSLFFSGDEASIEKLSLLIRSLDVPLKQVFIEVLVIETTIDNSLDFGLKWSMEGRVKEGLKVGHALNPQGNAPTLLTDLRQGEGSSHFPFGTGFDLEIIGDVIFHKGRSFLSLGSLITALQQERESSIVLNQKIMTQENKLSKIFVGNNIPFTGSVVQTIGTGQQTTANIEYRDIGVSLNITPLLGDSDVITLEIYEEITEALDHPFHKTSQLSGIQTSKTNMTTRVHVPDGHFLILSGMTRTTNSKAKSGPPCLGGIPLIGSLFSRKENTGEKSNLLIFVKPHILHSKEEYLVLSQEEHTSSLMASGKKESEE